MAAKMEEFKLKRGSRPLSGEKTSCVVDVAKVIFNNDTMLPFQGTNEGTVRTIHVGNSWS